MLAKVFTLCLFMGIVSCSHPENPSKEPDTEYFPLETGRYSEFKTQKISYEIGKTDQVTQFSYRLRIGNAFARADGRAAFPLAYSSLKQASAWQTDSITAAWQTDHGIFETENSQPVIKISFPLGEGAHWNANSFNLNAERICKVTQVAEPYRMQEQYFPNTITIIRQDDSTLLSRKKYIEVYALDVGLIRRERINLRYCYTGDCIGKGIITSGWKEITTIEKFGKQ